MTAANTKWLTRLRPAGKRLVIFLAVSAALLTAVGLEENWRAERDLRAEERAFRAHGESLDIADFVPPPIPDEQNFAAAPYIVQLLTAQKDEPGRSQKPAPKIPELLPNSHAPLPGSGAWEFGKPTDLLRWQDYFGTSGAPAAAVLEGLSKFGADLAKFNEAAARPKARFPLDYASGFAVALSHLPMILRFPKLFTLRAAAELEANDSAAALRDLDTLLQVQAALAHEPLLFSHLVRLNVLAYAQQVIWQGVAGRHWDATALTHIEQRLSAIDLPAEYLQSLRGERAFDHRTVIDMVAKPRRDILKQVGIATAFDPERYQNLNLFPFPLKAVLLRNAMMSDSIAREKLFKVADARAHRIYASQQTAADRAVAALRTMPYNFIAKLTFPLHRGITLRTATATVALDEARVACAIERFRLANGRLPDSLAQLGGALPHDAMSGAPLHYRREGDDSYILYSVGWNEIDDGGKVVAKSKSQPHRDDEQGDWVWFGSVQAAAPAP